MTPNLETQLKQLQRENANLKQAVFNSQPWRSQGYFKWFFQKSEPKVFGGADDYEMWLRSLDFSVINELLKLYTGVIDSLRYRREFIRHEIERRNLHGIYGKHSTEVLKDTK